MTEFGQEAIKQLTALIPVAAGALIALLGGVAKYFVENSQHKKKLRREKLEQTTLLVLGLRNWSDKIDDFYTTGISRDRVESPLEELETLGTLYFPELAKEMKRVLAAATAYKGVAIAFAGERLNSGAQLPQTRLNAIDAPYTELLKAIDAFSEQAAKLVRDGTVA